MSRRGGFLGVFPQASRLGGRQLRGRGDRLYVEGHDIRGADLDAFAIEVAVVEVAQIDQGLAVDHAEHTLITSGDADFAADAVAGIDGEGGVARGGGDLVVLDEMADRAGGL